MKGVVERAATGVRAGGYRGLAMPGATALLHAPLSNLVLRNVRNTSI